MLRNYITEQSIYAGFPGISKGDTTIETFVSLPSGWPLGDLVIRGVTTGVCAIAGT